MNTVLLFKCIQVLSIVVLFALFVYTKMQKPSEMQKYLTMICLGMMLMLFGYLLEMQAKGQEAAYYGNVISYIGSPFMMAAMLLMVATFYGKTVPKWAFILMMGYALMITVLVATNPIHYKYYTYVGFNPNVHYSQLVLKHGPLYILNLLSIGVYSLGVLGMVARGYVDKKVSRIRRRLSFHALMMVLSSLAGFGLYFLDPLDGYDTTMFGLTVATYFLAALFFRCRIFDVLDSAKDNALDASDNGLMIFDDSGSLSYENATASRLVDGEIPADYIDTVADGMSIYKTEDQESVYMVRASSLKYKSYNIGRSVEIHDISESYHYSERLQAAVDEATDKLEDIQRTIFGSFASLVEARSLETGDHIKRVARYTEMIAKTLQSQGKYPDILTDEFIRMLVYSSSLHDVGKISIPDSVLLKPGKLTEEEFAVMKTHSELGAKAIRTTMEGLESETYVKLAEDIAMHHHERWDGTGYPSGLKETEIPLSARIVAIADCYDAMTSKRCYKEAFPDAKALGIIQAEAGTHFDPELVEIFLNCKASME